MPYYVIAIHTDSLVYRTFGTYESFDEAEQREKDMEAGRDFGANYAVEMIIADDVVHLQQKIHQIRTERGYPV